MSNKKVSIGLLNPKSPTNVGAVMRAAGCFNADAIYYTGQRYARAARFQTDTKNVTLDIPLTALEHLFEAATAGTKIICVDLIEGAVALPDFEHPNDALYIFGPEDGTITQDIIDRADACVYIPTVGCLNLAATVNVLLYDRLAKSASAELPDKVIGDELIRQSRDTNNRVKMNSDI